MTKTTKTLRMLCAAALFLAAPSHAVTLHLHNGGDVSSLDPHKVSGDWENRVVGDLFEGLMTEDIHAEPTLGMAERFEVSDDGTVYTFYLRDAKWSDGHPVTAEDFVFAFRRLMNPESAAKYAWLQFTIKNAKAINNGDLKETALGVEEIDERTLRITLEQSTPYFLGALTHYTAYPIPKHAYDKYSEDWVKPENIVSNGPYMATEWIPGSHVRSKKNPLHHAASSVQIDEVVYYALEDNAAALKRYEAGEFDILNAFPTDQIERLRKEIPDQLHVAPFSGLYYYPFNYNHKPLDDKRVRQALSMAVNREVITDRILGTGEKSAYSWVPPGMANYGTPEEVSWKHLSYDDRVAQAKQLLGEAGYGPEGKPLKFVLRYNTDDNHKRIAVAVAAMWKQLGVEIELFNSEVKVHYADLNENDFEIARAGWLTDYNDPINMLELLQSENLYNYGRWRNSEYDKLLAQSAKMTDLDQRARTLAKAERIAMDDSAGIPIYYYVSRNIVSPKIKGYVDNAFNIHRTRYLSKN